jgi:hypothetical protein
MDNALACPDECRVVVKRVSDRDIKMRGLRVMLDGDDWTDLQFGKTAEKCVPPGKHVLTVSNTVYKREIEFEAGPNREVSFSAGNFVQGIGAIMVIVFGMGPYKVFLEQEAA